MSLGDEERAGRVHHYILWEVELSGGGRPAISAEAGRSVASHGGDDPVGTDPPDSMAMRVDDEEIAGRVHRHAARVGELCGSGRSAVSAEASGSVAGDRGDNAVGTHLPDAVAGLALANVEMTSCVNSDATWESELGGSGGPAVSAHDHHG